MGKYIGFWQALISVAYMSVPTVSTNFSVVYQHHINNTTTLFTKSVLTLTITTIDWPCRQCLGHLYVSQPVLFSVWREDLAARSHGPLHLSWLDWPCRHWSRSSMSAVIISQHGFS